MKPNTRSNRNAPKNQKCRHVNKEIENGDNRIALLQNDLCDNKKDDTALLPNLLEYVSDHTGAYSVMSEAFNSRTTLRTYERKDHIYFKTNTIECSQTSIKDGQISIPKGEGSVVEKSFSKSAQSVSVHRNTGRDLLMNRRLKSNLTPQAILPVSSGKRVHSQIASNDIKTSFQTPKLISRVPQLNIPKQYFESTVPKDFMLKQDLFYSKNMHDYHKKVMEFKVTDLHTLRSGIVNRSRYSQVQMNSERHKPVYLKNKVVPALSFSEKSKKSVKQPRQKLSLSPSSKKENSVSSSHSVVSELSSSVLTTIASTKSNIASTPSTPGRGKGRREMDQLYKSLKEISWAQDKDFTTLLYSKNSVRHSGRTSILKSATTNRSKKLAQLKKNPVPAKRLQKRPRSLAIESKNRSISVYMRKRIQKSTNIARGKQIKSHLQHSMKPLAEKKFPHPKQTITLRNKKSTTASPSVKSVAVEKKDGSQSIKLIHNEKKTPCTNQVKVNKSKTTWGNISCGMHTETGVLSESNNVIAALRNSPELRVSVKPLEKTYPWACDFHVQSTLQKEFIAHNRRAPHEKMLKVLASINQKHVSSVLREVHDSIGGTCGSIKISKKKVEESIRSSVRQSECAFRYKEIVVKKHDNYLQVVLVPNLQKQNSLTVEAVKELNEVFLAARKDSNCKAVLLNSSGSFFCSGIDLGQLYGSNKKHIAEEMASALRDLILTLAIFPKPLVAAVNGSAVGLGVSLLPYCDIVLASDKATFCIPAAKIGYTPEGGATLTLPQVVGSSCALEMLTHGRRLTAQQALKLGLVSEVLWPTQFMEEVVPRMDSLVEQSLQVMETTKTMVRCHLWERLSFQLDREWRLLPSQWLSSECQQNIKYLLQTRWLYEC